MKKLLLAIILLLTGVTASVARDYVTTDVNVLPVAARTFLKNNFKKSVNHINVDKQTFGGTEYDVILNDGTEVEFDGDGRMKSVDCGNNAVPSSVVPKAISDYVSRNYKGQKIVELEINKNNYEVQLRNGLELKFDRSGRFLKLD